VAADQGRAAYIFRRQLKLVTLETGDAFKDAKSLVGYLRTNAIPWESGQLYEHAK
jgi:hypothetical protein